MVKETDMRENVPAQQAGRGTMNGAAAHAAGADPRSSRTLMDWVIASRPWSFPASLAPVLVVTAWLYWRAAAQGVVAMDWWCALLALLMLVLMQASGNLISDFYDHTKGIDLPGSLNGVRHIQSGKFLPREILHYGYACLAVAAVLGLGILMRCGWQATWLGVAGVLLVVCYPWLKAHALGDIDILLGYALLPALGVGYAVGGGWMWQPVLLIVPVGLVTVAILHANNTRDILNDTRAGIMTLSIGIGGRASQWVYALENALAYLLIPVLCACGMISWLCMATWLTLPMAYRNVSTMLHAQPLAEKPIATVDQQTAQTQMAFCLLYTVSLFVSAWIGL